VRKSYAASCAPRRQSLAYEQRDGLDRAVDNHPKPRWDTTLKYT
jgi:hypothetical protein